MINLTIGTNTSRKRVNVDPNVSIREALENNEVDYSTTTLHLDGASLQPGDLDKSFSEFGITEKAHLIAIVKADNAIFLIS